MSAMLLDKRAESFGPDKRHVAGENQKRRARIGKRAPRSHDGVARAALLDLGDEDCAVLIQFFAHGCPDLFGLMPDDDVNGTRCERRGRATDMRDQRSPAELVQDFRRARAHTRPESGGED
jgi:hypothetical protein